MWASERFFLFIEPAATHLYYVEQRVPVRVRDFAPDAAGLADFAAWRREKADAPLAILTDLPDEGFVLEAIPRLAGAERRAVIARKLKRHFPDTPYVAAQSLPWETEEPEKRGRREETLLLASLPAAPLETWLARAKPVSGLYALTQLFAAASHALDLPRDCIVLTLRGDRLRQTWMQAGVPCFSRVISLSGDDTLLAETRRLATYLARQPLFPLQTEVPLCPLFALSENERVLLATEFAVLPNVATDDAFFLALLTKRPPKTQYAPKTLRKNARLPELKRLAWAVGIISLVTGVTFGFYAIWQAATLRQQTDAMRQEAEAIRVTLTIAEGEEDTLPFDGERAALLLSVLPEELPKTLATDLQALSRLLDAFPALRLESLGWDATGRKMMLELRVEAEDEARSIAALRHAAQLRGFREERMESNSDDMVKLVFARD
ncbi:MAG: hypothetical protein LBQ75_07895 [Zoogloeaceae bacterium]|jgi:hypothetical protein|nr:hypothetical protein [Zoogloeaceae bacterium]